MLNRNPWTAELLFSGVVISMCFRRRRNCDFQLKILLVRKRSTRRKPTWLTCWSQISSSTNAENLTLTPLVRGKRDNHRGAAMYMDLPYDRSKCAFNFEKKRKWRRLCPLRPTDSYIAWVNACIQTKSNKIHGHIVSDKASNEISEGRRIFIKLVLTLF